MYKLRKNTVEEAIKAFKAEYEHVCYWSERYFSVSNQTGDEVVECILSLKDDEEALLGAYPYFDKFIYNSCSCCEELFSDGIAVEISWEERHLCNNCVGEFYKATKENK